MNRVMLVLSCAGIGRAWKMYLVDADVRAVLGSQLASALCTRKRLNDQEGLQFTVCERDRIADGLYTSLILVRVAF